MKLHSDKILLFALPLNILVASYQEHNKNKASITPHHTPIYTSRVFSECDTQSSICDNDADMKSVMQHFDDRTSQRLREYDERMQDKRQKHKEQRDKNIEQIILKDKMEKSLAERIEKGCLRCGCGLGGGVLPVWGLVSGLWYATLSQHVTKLAIQKGIAEGLKVGLAEITKIFQKTSLSATVPKLTVDQMLSSEKFTNGVDLFDMIRHINTMSNNFPEPMYNQFWLKIDGMVTEGGIDVFNANNSANIAAVTEAFEKCKAAEFASHTSLLSNTIIASVVTILVIVLVMIIVYLVLRYRRKKKMKKKAQYTKLLNT
ncbi:rifin PIR protein, putative [Plasmodium reichenowi]|uniref:Rifin PIR protein, putative n=1 Tax=Plasmodium reichenowi TaxID=5854 RepID=A0A2P9DIX4_PLARE|nr:rifin PIR protein, putative [Plasmodium reichenowi]